MCTAEENGMEKLTDLDLHVDCNEEMKKTNTMLAMNEETPINCEVFSSLGRLLRVTGLVFKFIKLDSQEAEQS